MSRIDDTVGVTCGSAAFVLAAWLLSADGARAQGVRGQWDFDSGNLQAAVGLALEYYDPNANGHTAAKTQFGTTASFGISAINGQVAGVMKFPGCLSDEGYVMHTNAPPNGGGSYVNKYTIIMDLLFPSSSSNAWRALFQTNRDNANDADLFVGTTNGIGVSGQYHGTLTANAWHRIAVTVDLTTLTMAKYIDGAQVGTQTLADNLDGRWSLYGTNIPPDRVLLFTDEDNETKPGYVNSIQFRDYVMTPSAIASLGGPAADGVPLPPPTPTNIAQWDFNGNLASSTGGDALVAGAASPAQSGSPGVSFQLATIGGSPAQVAAFTRGTYFQTTHGLAANGGGTLSSVNQYTLILDVMFTNTAASGWAALWQTSATNGNDGEWFIRYPDMGIGISGVYAGYVPDNVWHRLALVVDNVARTLVSYVDGQPVQQLTDGLALDGRWALDPVALLFADDNGENAAGYVNSVQIRGYAMSGVELDALGGATAAGIPLPTMPGDLHVVSPTGGERWQAGSTQTVAWTATNPDGAVRIELYDGATPKGEVGQAVMSAGQYSWLISPHVGDSTNYSIKLSSVTYPTVADFSDAVFEIYGSTPVDANITKLPMLQGPQPDAMTLLWETDADAADNAVDWGITDISENTTTSVITEQVDATHFVHTVTFGPLQAETAYRYRVRSGTAASPVFSFRTAPRRMTPINVAWFADEQGYGVFRQHIPHIAARDPDVLMFSGDLLPDGGSISNWQDYWFGPLEISNFSQTTPVLFSRGNHDGEGTIAYKYSALPGNEAWFAFTYGNVRFIFLDTNLYSSEQTAWLQSELASAEAQSAQFRVISFHKPPFTDLWDSMGYIGEDWVRTDWVPLFEQYKADVVINGHTHAYSRGDRNGVMYMIVGGAGGALDTVRSYDWGFFDVLASVFHYNIMAVNRNTLTWTAYDLNDAVLDSYVLQSRTPVWPEDADGDGDVDLADFGTFQACFNGPNRPWPVVADPNACRSFDQDNDGDVDLSDFSAFQACFNGPNRPPACR
jgi:predicted phosphodiesterase